MASQIEMPIVEQLERKPLDPITPMMLLREAIANKYDMANLKDLFEMAKEWRQLDAEAAFNRDFALFKKNKPEILKNKTGELRGTSKSGKDYAIKYDWADLFEVADKVGDRLADFGIAHTYESETRLIQAGTAFVERIKVTCLLKHAQGYTHRGASLEGPPDKSGAKNEVQAILSGSTYLERKTLLMTSGCAPRDIDQDGGGKQEVAKAMSEAELKDRLATYANCHTFAEVDQHHNASFGEAKRIKDQSAMDAFYNAKVARRDYLRKAGAQ